MTAHADAVAVWLGSTKAVDAAGAPLVLYHGTHAVFDTFIESVNPSGRGNLKGFYFTTDRSAAEEFGPVVMEVCLNLQQPFVGNPRQYYAEHLGVEVPGFGSPPSAWVQYRAVTPQAVRDHLISEGFDGVIIPSRAVYNDHDEYIVFSPEQIYVITDGAMPTEQAAKVNNRAAGPQLR